MKPAYIILVTILFISNTTLAQKNEVGIGFPQVAYLAGGSPTSYSFIDRLLKDNSSIYPLTMHTKRSSALQLPIIYYTRTLGEKTRFRSSLNYQREKIIHEFNKNTADAGDISDDYRGRFSMIKLTTGISYIVFKYHRNKFYTGADISHRLIHILERGSYENNAWGTTFKNLDKDVTQYYLGIVPSIGYAHTCSKKINLSIEVGAEYSQGFNANYINSIFFTHLINRFSINYSF